MTIGKSILLFSSFLLTAGFASAQTEDKSKLEQERKEIQDEIRQIQGMYDKVKGQKKQTLGQLNLIQRKISLQNKYISNISKELRYINDDIFLANLEIYRMHKQLDTLKAQYARSVVYAYKNRSTYNFLNFIFSANSFNDALKRIAYLKSYRTYREEQVKNIIETQKAIEQRKQEQIARRSQKDEALKNQSEQVKVLDDQKKEKDAVVSKLKARESDLQKQLNAKKKKDKDLQNAIAAIVRREIEAAKKEAERKAALEKPNTTTTNPSSNVTTPVTNTETKPKSYLEFNAEDIRLGNSFEASRGKLPWPVDQGFVNIHFGSYEYVIDGNKRPLTGNNPGLTIGTPSAGVNVKSVFEGEVVGVFNLGDTKSVMIRHGKYFTVYSNLSSTSVSKGDMVKTGQMLGKTAADDEGGAGGKLEFLLMVETKNVNPEPWLRR